MPRRRLPPRISHLMPAVGIFLALAACADTCVWLFIGAGFLPIPVVPIVLAAGVTLYRRYSSFERPAA